MTEKFLPPRPRARKASVPPAQRQVARPASKPKDINLTVGGYKRLARRASRITGMGRMFR